MVEPNWEKTMSRISRILTAAMPMAMPMAMAMAIACAAFGSGSLLANGGVQDAAKLFSPEAVRKADVQIQKLREVHKKEILVETLESLPAKEKGGPDLADKQATSRWVNEYALGRAKAQSVNGIYFLLIKEPAKFQFEIGNKTAQKEFTNSDRDEVTKIIQPLLKAKKMDEALDALVGFISTKVNLHQPQAGRAVAQGKPAKPVQDENDKMNPILGYLCVGAAAIAAIMLLIGLFRGLTGGGGGGVGAPGMGGGYGGGGGGFMSNMLGGMFGAAAGMWMYDHFMGHSGSQAWGAGGTNTDGTAGGDTSSGQDSDYSGSGGDWGGGGDAGAGGGDWGGGGGGDFGGGGGDY